MTSQSSNPLSRLTQIMAIPSAPTAFQPPLWIQQCIPDRTVHVMFLFYFLNFNFNVVNTQCYIQLIILSDKFIQVIPGLGALQWLSLPYKIQLSPSRDLQSLHNWLKFLSTFPTASRFVNVLRLTGFLLILEQARVVPSSSVACLFRSHLLM